MKTCFIFRYFCLLLVILSITIVSGCSSLPNLAQSGVKVKITSVPLKIVMVAGGAALQIAMEEFAGIKIDYKDLLRQIVEVEDVTTGVPPNDIPVIMVVNKKNNDILYWQLTDNVKMLRLKHEQPGTIELKVINETPLRIELWMDGDLEEIRIDVEMNE